jgi:hypothetical protein
VGSGSKYFLVLWALVAVIGAALYLSKPENRFLLLGLGVLVLVIVIPVVRERLRRKKEGYYVSKRGGADDGILVYNEGGKTLQLYFNRANDTIYVPSDLRWQGIMPDWARERKKEIVSRIQKRVGKRLIGKSWTYEESDRKEHLINQG